MDWITFGQNLVESLIIAFMSSQYIEVHENRRMIYIFLFTAVFTACISTLNYFVFYEGFLSLIYSLLFLGLMWPFKSETIEQPLQNLSIYILFWNIIESASSEITILVFTFLTKLDIAGLFSSNYAQMLFYISKPIMLLLMLTVNKLTEKYKSFQSSFSKYFVIIFLLLFAVVTINEKYIADNISIYKTLICINLLLFATAFYSYYIFNQSAYMSFQSMENSEMKQQMRSIRQNIRIYKDDEKKIRALKHDLTNQFTILKEYLDMGETDQCRKILEKSLQTLEVTTLTVSTGNPAVDAILTSKLSYARNLGIMVFTAICLHKINEKTDFDVALLLGNLLDNAIENISAEKPRIRLNIQQNNDEIIIQLSNTTDGSDNTLITKKADPENHGFGISSIRKIARLYDGTAEFELSDNVFTSLIRLRCN